MGRRFRMIHRGGTGVVRLRRGPIRSYFSVKTNTALPAGKCSTSGQSAG